MLCRALFTPYLGVRGDTPRVFRCSRAVGERTGRGPRGSSRSPAIPPRAPSPGKGTQTGGPSCPGRVSATAARGRGGSPGGLARGMSPPSLRGRKCGGPESGIDSAGSCWPGLPSPSPALRALHRTALFRAPPRGQLRRGTAARVGLREPGAGGRVRRIPKEGFPGGYPDPGRVVWLGSQSKNVWHSPGFGGHCRNPPAPASNPPPLRVPLASLDP